MTNDKRDRTDNNGAFSRKIIILLLLALLISAGLTFLIYYYTVRVVYTNSISNTYTNHAADIAESYADYVSNNIDRNAYETTINVTSEILDSTIIVYMHRENIFNFYQANSEVLDADFVEDARNSIIENNYSILNQRTTSFTAEVGTDEVDSIFIGYPIVAIDSYSGARTTVGSVYIITEISDINAEITNLNFSLVLASSLTFLLILFPLLYIIKRLIDPLIETKNIAIAMTEGDFSQRARVTSQDEIGDLARSINNLADDLDETLSSLTNERNRLEQIINGLSEGIYAVYNDLELMHINPALAELFGLGYMTKEEASTYVLGIEGIVPSILKVLNTEEDENFIYKHRDKSIYIHIDALIDSEDEVYGAVALFRDVTEALNLERTRVEYISNISHELRTPLTAIRGLLEPISDGLVKDESSKNKYYKIILEESMRLSRLIDDMMSLSSLQSGQMNVEPDQIDAHDFFYEVYYKYSNAMNEKNIQFEIPKNLSSYENLYINRDRLEQVIVIILDNAMKFTDEGGKISMHLYDDKQKEDSVVLEIRDSGVGIDEHDIDHVFDRFYKADKARETYQGTGLGLSLAKEILGELGEKIWVKSKKDIGSSFFITIALAEKQEI